MNRGTLRAWGLVLGVAIAASLTMAAFTPRAQAIPSWSRKYGVSCAKCHTAFPRLNTYGYMFRLHGYQVPNDELLGKIDTGDELMSLLDQAPLSARLVGSVKETSGDGENPEFNFDQQLGLFFGGTAAKNVGFFVEGAMETEDGEFHGEVEFIHLKFAHLLHSNPTALNLELGVLSLLEWGNDDHWRLTRNSYTPYRMSVGNNDHTFHDGVQGLAIYGMLGGGGSHLAQAAPATQLVSADPSSAGGAAEADSEPVSNYNDRSGILYQLGVGSAGPSDGNQIQEFARLGYAFGNGPWITALGDWGKHDLSSGIEDFHRYLVELGWDFGSPIDVGGHPVQPLQLRAAWVSGHDSDPLGTALVVDHTAQYAELAYMRGDQHVAVVRWDRVQSSDLSSLEQNSLTAAYIFYLRRNVRFGIEGKFFSTGGNDTLMFFYDIGL